MQKLSNKNLLIYSDTDYTHAVNYRNLYNAPITLNFDDKHNRTKYILSAVDGENWAKNNGYDRLRISVIDLSIPPNFIKAINIKG